MSRTTFNSENVGRAIVSDSLKPHGNRQAPLSMGFPRQEYWSVLSFPSPGDLPDPETKPASPVLQADSLPSEPSGKKTVKIIVNSPYDYILIFLDQDP